MTIIVERSLNNGTQEIHRFDNGYGASKVMHDCSYGGDRNVIGHLTYSEAQAVLQQIKELT